MLSVLLAVLMQASATPPPATAPSAKPSVITNPDWIRRPTGVDLAKFYPEDAARREIEGFATIACEVAATGRLVNCSVVAEQPAEAGFGQAALGMSPIFEMRPQTRDGVAVAGGTVRIPIRFSLPKGPTEPIPSLAVASRCYGFAAARLEAEPAVDEARLAFFAFRMLIELKMASQKMRPTELDARLLALRVEGAQQQKDPSFAEERKRCAQMTSAFGREGFDRMISEAADKP